MIAVNRRQTVLYGYPAAGGVKTPWGAENGAGQPQAAGRNPGQFPIAGPFRAVKKRKNFKKYKKDLYKSPEPG
jgi:hypothetical protein